MLNPVPKIIRFLGTALAAAMLPGTAAAPPLPSPWKPAATEIVRLPRYCWAQFDASYRSQGMPTPVELCGIGMNHLCPGLVQLNRAGNTTYDRQLRKGSLGQARIEIDYTLARVPASCSIAPDVRAADARIKALQLLLR